jgi:putative transcriptional regulator
MTTKPKFKSDAFESIHGSAKALFKVGAISKTTLREFDVACQTKLPNLTAARIRLIREKHHVSQPVFARMLNISESTVQKWESGAKQPSGIALKMLTVVEKHGLKSLA